MLFLGGCADPRRQADGVAVIFLQAGALILGLAVIGLILVMDRPEDMGRVSPGWLRRDREGR